MGTRMDKYKNEEVIPTRSDKNKELYKQIYNAYDNFENLVIPPNAREIKPSELKREVTSRDEYRKLRDYDEITNNKIESNNTIIRKEKVNEEQQKENEIYDINELLNNAVTANKQPDLVKPILSNDDYLKKLKLDNTRTNIEQVKEMFDDIKEESSYEDEALMHTANLSLEILSDLKGDNDKTIVSAPIKDEELPVKDMTSDFYSSTYKFTKKDFEDKEYEEEVDEEDEELDDEEEKEGSGKFFFKILMLIFGILLIILILLYCINYFNRV